MVISKRRIAVALLLLTSSAFARAITATGEQPKLIPMPREYTPREPVTLAHGVSITVGAVLVRYDLATQLWVLRSAKFAAARNQWQQHHTLPAPAELGLP